MITTYKMRAECMPDVLRFIERTHVAIDTFKVKRCSLVPDVVITFKSILSKNQIINELNEIVDSHVMIETLETEGNYTGIRKVNPFKSYAS